MANNIELVRQRISLGLDVNYIDSDKGSALMQAVHRDNFDLVQLLLRHGASVIDVGPHGKCAMQYVRSSKMAEILNTHCVNNGIKGYEKSVIVEFKKAEDVESERRKGGYDHIDLGGGDKIELQNELLDYKSAIDIDQYLVAIEPIISDLEIHCVAGCCGLHAFDFTRNVIRGMKDKHAMIRKEIRRSIESLRSIQGTTIISNRMNAYMNINVFISLLEYIDEELS